MASSWWDIQGAIISLQRRVPESDDKTIQALRNALYRARLEAETLIIREASVKGGRRD